MIAAFTNQVSGEPGAAQRAVSSASAGEASMKWNVVPPCISIDGRG
jgi:hypothetical protein